MKKIITIAMGAAVMLAVSACTKTETNNETVVVNETTVNETLDADNASMVDENSSNSADASNDK